MRLATESHQLIETFMAERFGLEMQKLPPISLHHGRVAGWLTRTLKISAITFGRHIFVAPKRVARDESGRLSIPGWLIVHEATHVLQYERAGFFGFLFSYLCGYWRALRAQQMWNKGARMAAYLAIEEECDARDAEAAFKDWIARGESGL
ncbi:MAG: DUF4157 domain-containing protein [Acidobacteria bacterium]|nr:DUF4157 domain-containing protein [Acidobacteriota bacterium]